MNEPTIFPNPRADRAESEVLRLRKEMEVMQRERDDARSRLVSLWAQVEVGDCAVARPGEGTIECRAESPCGLCRLRARAEKAERDRSESDAALRLAMGETCADAPHECGECVVCLRAKAEEAQASVDALDEELCELSPILATFGPRMSEGPIALADLARFAVAERGRLTVEVFRLTTERDEIRRRLKVARARAREAERMPVMTERQSLTVAMAVRVVTDLVPLRLNSHAIKRIFAVVRRHDIEGDENVADTIERMDRAIDTLAKQRDAAIAAERRGVEERAYLVRRCEEVIRERNEARAELDSAMKTIEEISAQLDEAGEWAKSELREIREAVKASEGENTFYAVVDAIKQAEARAREWAAKAESLMRERDEARALLAVANQAKPPAGPAVEVTAPALDPGAGRCVESAPDAEPETPVWMKARELRRMDLEAQAAIRAIAPVEVRTVPEGSTIERGPIVEVKGPAPSEGPALLPERTLTEDAHGRFFFARR